MNHFICRLVAAAFGILVTAATTHGAVIATVYSNGTVGGYYRYDVRITAFTGVDAIPGGTYNRPGIGLLSGTFSTQTGRASLAFPGSTLTWKVGTISSGGDGGSFNPPHSFVNMDFVLGAATHRTPDTATTVDVSQVTGQWLVLGGDTYRISTSDLDAGTPDDDGVDENLLFSVFALPDTMWHWTFIGSVATYGSYSTPFSINYVFLPEDPPPPIWPEPTGLTPIVTLGLLGLRCTARRPRLRFH